MEKSEMHFSALREIDEAINSKREPRETLKLIAQMITYILGVSGTSVLVRDGDKGELKSIASCCLSQALLSKGLPTADKSLAETLMGNTVLISGALEKEGIGQILSLPIYVNQEVIGALRVYAPVGYEFSKEAINFVEVAREKVSLAIQNAPAYQIFGDYRGTMMTRVCRSFNAESRVPKLNSKILKTPISSQWQARL